MGALPGTERSARPDAAARLNWTNAHGDQRVAHIRAASANGRQPALPIGRRNPLAGVSQDSMDTSRTTPSQARAEAIAELFAALDRLLRSYRAIPEDERDERWAADADLITGEIARRLAVARACMSRSSPPVGGLTTSP